MIKEEVKHIFARSACLSKKQFEKYLAGNMITEEIYGVEHNINGCPLCSMAMDGMQMRTDATEVTAGLNAEFLKEQLEAMPEPGAGGAAAYVKNLKQGQGGAKPIVTGLKIGVAIAACAGILWFVQRIGQNSKAEAQLVQTEGATGGTETEQPEERSVVVEQPLVAEAQGPVSTPPVETQLIEEAPATPEPATSENKPVITGQKKEEQKKEVSTKPVTPVTAKTSPETTTAKPPTAAAKNEEKKPAPAMTKTQPAVTAPKTIALPPPPPPVIKEIVKEQPKPQPQIVKQEPEHKPAPKEEPKPQPVAKKEEPAMELPSDPIAAGKALMDKRSYNAAINKMRNEMRSNNKSRRQEAVMLVAKCYQAMGNKERAKELLSSIVDEGGPEKKNAKKMLKEVDGDAKKEE